MCGPQSNDAIETPKFLKLVRPSHHLPYGVLGPRARTGNVAPCRVVRRLESPHDSHLLHLHLRHDLRFHKFTGAPGRIRTCAPRSGGACSIP